MKIPICYPSDNVKISWKKTFIKLFNQGQALNIFRSIKTANEELKRVNQQTTNPINQWNTNTYSWTIGYYLLIYLHKNIYKIIYIKQLFEVYLHVFYDLRRASERGGEDEVKCPLVSIIYKPHIIEEQWEW